MVKCGNSCIDFIYLCIFLWKKPTMSERCVTASHVLKLGTNQKLSLQWEHEIWSEYCQKCLPSCRAVPLWNRNFSRRVQGVCIDFCLWMTTKQHRGCDLVTNGFYRGFFGGENHGLKTETCNVLSYTIVFLYSRLIHLVN